MALFLFFHRLFFLFLSLAWPDLFLLNSLSLQARNPFAPRVRHSLPVHLPDAGTVIELPFPSEELRRTGTARVGTPLSNRQRPSATNQPFFKLHTKPNRINTEPMAEPFNQLDDDDLYPTPTAPRASPTATVTGSPLVPPPEYGYTVSFNVGVGQPLPTMSLENADTDPIQRRNQHNITGNDESLHALPAYEGTGSSPVHLASSSSQSTRKRKISERAEEVDSSTPSKHQRTEYDTASESNARRVAERHSSSRPISPAERIPNVFTSHRKRQHSEGDNAIKTKHHRMTTRNDASSSRIPASPPIIAQSSLDRLQANDESFESIFNPTSANHQAQFRPSGPIRDSPQEVPRDPRLRSRGYLSGEGVSPDEISPPNHLTDLPDMENYRLDSPDLRCTGIFISNFFV
ncbi:hypothetical protein DFH07DRAFT_549238 [Mycena maculata]|uniref:Uncharacterized protein n=1 Tax=Mycena maculata TaxID=230809 RepID=A0AAD7ITX9_9AGAR|nr:hypothetical protein DFH07DRAFT_549238 [Mycena maculata]